MIRVNLINPRTPLCRYTMFAGLSLLFACTAVAEQAPPQHVNALQAQLQQLGWQVEHTAAGGLLLWPPGQQQRSEPTALLVPTIAGVEDSTAVMNLDALRQKLIDKGWDVRTNDDGSLLLYFSAEPGTPAKSESQSQQPPEHFEALSALLHASGWRVKQDQAGNLEVYPQTGTTAHRNSYTQLQVQNTEMDRLGETLSASGWRLKEQADGSVSVYADSKTSQQSESSSSSVAGATQAAESAGLKTGRPVDSPAKAHRIAEDWAGQQSRTDLVVGRVRRVHWIYLVDIFQNTPPFYLHNQLAIRYRDGRIFPLL